MDTAIGLLHHTKKQLSGWSWFKKAVFLIALLAFGTSSFLYLTPPGLSIREFLAETVISTQHRDWAWIFVGEDKRNAMVTMSHQFTESSATEKQNLSLIKHEQRRSRSIDELISDVKDISGQFWKGKMIYVYDPTSVRVVVPHKPGEGERISSMTRRTGAVAGINGGGFIDPDGLGNGFAPIGLILSGSDAVYADVEADTAQHIVGFTKEGTLVVGKYSLNELWEMNVTDAVSFLAPRLIANGVGQITNGDGGWGRAPRTAIGQREDGTLIFVIIDGRQAHSVGATLKEVQDLLLKEGAVNAGMMDGGASSELVVNNELLTKPSSRYGERRLPSGILVFDRPEEYVADRVWDNLTKINAGGAFDHPDYLREQQLKRQQQQQQQQQQQPAKTEPPKAEPPKTAPAANTSTSNKTSSTPGTTSPPASSSATSPKPQGGSPGAVHKEEKHPTEATAPSNGTNAPSGPTGGSGGAPTGSGTIGTSPGAASDGSAGSGSTAGSTSSGSTGAGVNTGSTSSGSTGSGTSAGSPAGSTSGGSASPGSTTGSTPSGSTGSGTSAGSPAGSTSGGSASPGSTTGSTSSGSTGSGTSAGSPAGSISSGSTSSGSTAGSTTSANTGAGASAGSPAGNAAVGSPKDSASANISGSGNVSAPGSPAEGTAAPKPVAP